MMSRNLRKKQRISYYEPEEPNLDEYVFCSQCADYVYEYCAIHGALLVVPDDKVPLVSPFPPYVPRAALTIPSVFLHIAPSRIPGAGLGIFTTLTMPEGVRFGPYGGKINKEIDSDYCWQIYDKNRKAVHVIDAGDPNISNWMRYVNCARHSREQNIVAFQYRGQIYYRTTRIIPRHTELLVYYGAEFARRIGIDPRRYNAPCVWLPYMKPIIQKCAITEEKIVTTSDDVKVKEVDETLVVAQEDVERSSVYTPGDKQTSVKKIENEKVIGTDGISENNATYSRKGKIDKISVKKRVKTFDGLDKKFKCDICMYCTNNKCNLTCHLRTHTGEKPFKCNVCDKKFTQIGNLTSHLRTHTGEKPFKCNVCDKKFTNIGNLTRHLRTHTGEKPFKCNVCDKKFSNSSDLTVHLRTHTGEKPFKCNVCDKKFTHSISLKLHNRTHTGEKPFKCNVCDKKFTHSISLKLHNRTHTGEKPFKCNVCDKKFTQIANLRSHLRTHTGEKPFKCNVCDKKFTHSISLKLHNRTHTGEKPFKCNVCDKKFTKIANLRSHLRTHTGEKPFKCNVCDKKFTHSISLKLHNRTHTGEKPFKCNVSM